MTSPNDIAGIAVAAAEIAEKVAPLLAGHGAEVQGAALAFLTTTWVCGHHPVKARPTILLSHFEGIADMVKRVSARVG